MQIITTLENERTQATPAVFDVVQSAQSGCHLAFEEIQRVYGPRLFKQIIAITRHHEDAEDALQEALCNAYMSLPMFERRCHIYTWLSRIAINCALIKVRKRHALREFSLDTPNESDSTEPPFEIADQAWSQEEVLRAKERLQRIAKVADSLDPISKNVLHLRANCEYSMEEIASDMNMSVSAVKARLYRARHVLRVFLPDTFATELV